MTRSSRRARAVGAVGALLAATLLTACTSPGGGGLETPSVTLEAVAPPALLDAAAVGLVETGAESEVATPEASVATSALAIFPALAQAASAFLTDLGAPDPAVMDVVLADRQVLGVKVNPDPSALPDGAAQPGTVFYGDVASGAAWPARDLLETDSARELEAAVREALAGDGDGDGDGDPTGDGDGTDTVDETDVLCDLRFTARGDLVVVAPDGERAWQLADIDEVTLSDAGRLVRGAVRQGGAFLGPVSSDPLSVAPASVPLPPAPLPPLPPPTGAPAPVDCHVLKCVAITFDDGPGPETPRLLDMLAAHSARATFYLVGNRVGSNAATAKAILDAGHAVGNHTWNHPDLRTLDTAGVASQVDRTTQAIIDATGQAPTTMRPPYGAIDDAVAAELASDGLPAILWNVDSLDWKSKNTEATVAEVMAHVRPGSIVLLHDIHATTVDAVPAILDQLAAQGYTFVTVDQLLGQMTPGQKYFSLG